MQLVIDIDEDDYKNIKEYYEKNDTVEATYSYIYHGIPLDKVLDKIRAEIERMDYLNIEDGSDGYDNYVDRYDVLKIIDKYRKESE